MSRFVEALGHVGVPDPVRAPAEKPGIAEVRNRETQRLNHKDEVLGLVQRLFLVAPRRKAPVVIAFCAANRGTGCSWVCARAGETLARQAVGRVCIVDANVRAPALDRHFSVARAPGFTELVRTSAPLREFARPIQSGNLWLVTAGFIDGEVTSSLNALTVRARFSELRAEFDFVLVDTPAIDSGADALMFGQFADGVVLIVGSDCTRREAARHAKSSLESAQVPLLGAVLNKRTFPIPGAIYRNI